MDSFTKSPWIALAFLLCSTIATSTCRDPQDTGAIADSLEDAPAFEGTLTDYDAGLQCPAGSASPLNNAYSPYVGGEDSVDIVVTVSSDLQCPFCAMFAQMLLDMWKNRPDLLARVRLFFHHYPIESLHEDSPELHLIAAAASRQGMDKFWSFHDRLFAWRNDGLSYTVNDALGYLATIGVDMVRLDEDLADEQNSAFVKWDIDQSTHAGVQGTPTVFVCGQQLSNWANLERALDYFLK